MRKKLIATVFLMTLTTAGIIAGTVQVKVPLNTNSVSYMKGIGEGVMNVEQPLTKNISLIKLNKKQTERAIEAGKKYAKEKVIESETNYTAPNDKETEAAKSFYDTDKNPILDQGNFGTCVTFATTGLIGYTQDNNTDTFSQLYTLLKGYNDTGNVSDAGWNGLEGSMPLIDRINNNDKGYIFIRDKKQSDKMNYNKLSSSAADQGIPVLSNDEICNAINNLIYGDNKSMIDAFNANIPKAVKLNLQIKPLEVSQGNSQNSEVIKNELDAGRKVVIGATMYGDKDQQMVFDGYKLASDGKSIKPDDAIKNTWDIVTDNPVGGHELIVASYFVDSDGKIMFLIRNSWGESAGDDGNYYMSEDYLNAATMDATSLYKTVSKIHAI